MANLNEMPTDTLATIHYVTKEDFTRALDGQEHYARLENQALDIARKVQDGIGEAYRSPFTFNAAREAARIALGLKTTTQEGEQ